MIKKISFGILAVLIMLCCSCGADEPSVQVEVIATFEAKSSQQLYACTVEIPDDIKIVINQYLSSSEQIGYLLPVTGKIYEHKKLSESEKVYWCTVQRNEGIDSIIRIWYNTKTRKIEGIYPHDKDIDWKSIAGYTSREEALFLYHEGIHDYAIIGNKAYCLNVLGGNLPQEINATPFHGGDICDILQ